MYLACERYANVLYWDAFFFHLARLCSNLRVLTCFPAGSSFIVLNVISGDDALTETHDETLMELPSSLLKSPNCSLGSFFFIASCLPRKIIVDIIHTFIYNGLASEEYNALECFINAYV